MWSCKRSRRRLGDAVQQLRSSGPLWLSFPWDNSLFSTCCVSCSHSDVRLVNCSRRFRSRKKFPVASRLKQSEVGSVQGCSSRIGLQESRQDRGRCERERQSQMSRQSRCALHCCCTPRMISGVHCVVSLEHPSECLRSAVTLVKFRGTRVPSPSRPCEGSLPNDVVLLISGLFEIERRIIESNDGLRNSGQWGLRGGVITRWTSSVPLP